ncbi:hypothetical protein GWK47_024570 [Chionoecetes opilio]|uniref:Uncharacterized protein n=1 Tax=Chionoecetes opilio TaxID=41210 RepID=A0A8J5CJ66_CHIOP|nr:hypothetical protein GWK47_024570 [Chionoecetes opilio]
MWQVKFASHKTQLLNVSRSGEALHLKFNGDTLAPQDEVEVQARAVLIIEDNTAGQEPHLTTLQHRRDVARLTVVFKVQVKHVSHLQVLWQPYRLLRSPPVLSLWLLTVTAALLTSRHGRQCQHQWIAVAKFTSQQLRLVTTPPNGRRYSSALMTRAAVWDKTSPKLYQDLYNSGIMCLPGRAVLRRLTSALSVQSETREGNVARTLLCTMINSIAGRYEDMIPMDPIESISADRQVLQGLTEVGYQVMSVTTDGHKVNTAFQAKLGVTPDKPWFANPFVENQEQHEARVHVINDTVHLWKNGFYQLLNKKKLVAPPFPGSKARIIN